MIKTTIKEDKVYVTFTVQPQEAQSVSLCGEWNDWQDEPMKPKKSGEFWVTKILPQGACYQFGYRVNGSEWLCDETLECVASPFGSQNSLLSL